MGDVNLRERIASNLERFERSQAPASSGTAPAAVAVTVLGGARGEPCVPIFQRPATMSRHAGQMALPGGRLHAGESDVECALRELNEELGIDADAAAVLGRLDDFETRSGFTITPVVVWAGEDPSALRPSPSEVARLFLVTPADLRQAAAAALPEDGFSMRFREVEVFAPTGAMLYQFSEVALDGRHVRVADFYQPPWTHR
jgi:8-oxo-dGTP pyrophosphatase MutT (NUDIX family)